MIKTDLYPPGHQIQFSIRVNADNVAPMRIFLLTAFAMLPLAANSVLNRMAIAGGHIGAVDFGTLRLFAGAVALALLCLLFRRGLRLGGKGRTLGVISLLLYMYGFSFAYNALDAGLGALILFGVVQITMFIGALVAGEALHSGRWVGAGLAFGGLIWLLWPGQDAEISLYHGVLMAAAGIGWGLYSLIGRTSGDAMMSTAANFIIAAPLGLLLGWVLPAQGEIIAISGPGVALAVASGAVTSGMGYALWYSILPHIASSVAAVAQLTVPILALIGGMIFLDEALTMRFVIACLLVLGGVAISVLPRKAA